MKKCIRILLGVSFVLVPVLVFAAAWPTISSISQSSASIGATVTINGSNFDNGSYVDVDSGVSSIIPSSYTGTSLTFVVPSGLSMGNHNLRVAEKASDAISNNVYFSVVTPTVSSFTVAPSSLHPNSYEVRWTIQNASHVELTADCANGLTIKEITDAGGEYPFLCGDVSRSVATGDGTIFLRFYNNSAQNINVNVTLSPYGTNSVTRTVVVAPPTPSISSINPSSAKAGDTVNVYGSNFDITSFIALDGSYGQSVTPTFISPTSLSFVVPSNTGTGVGSHTVQVGQKASSLPLSNSVTLTIVATPSISVISPNGGEQWQIGNNYQIRWNSSNLNFVTIKLVNNDTGGQYTIAEKYRDDANYSARGHYWWTVPSETGPIKAGQYKISLEGYDANYNLVASGSSNNSFSIVNTPTLTANITANNLDVGQITVKQGSYVTLNWNSSAATSCTHSGNFPWSNTPNDLSGTSVTLMQNQGVYTATITCQNNAGQSATDGVIITVSADQNAPSIAPQSGAAQKIQDLLDQVKALQAQLSKLQSSQAGTSATPPATGSTPSETGAPVNACVELSFNLTYRSRDALTNGDVSALQDFLQTKGYLNSEPTGFFGALTLQAVKKFQADNGINATGFVGLMTKAKIKELSCK